jgi:NhaP-type Na+/H+ or K+/H+ antiporter
MHLCSVEMCIDWLLCSVGFICVLLLIFKRNTMNRILGRRWLVIIWLSFGVMVGVTVGVMVGVHRTYV